MRPKFIGFMNEFGIDTQVHFVPLHSSPAGRRYGRIAGSMDVTVDAAAKLVRLPIHLELGDDVDRIIDRVRAWAACNAAAPK
jgi:dTDP-4-amino-4,6-dideoxygalactose transaminase